MVRGWNPYWGRGAKFLAPIQAGQPSLLHPVSFSGVKRLGRGADNSPPSSAEVKENADLFFYSPPQAFMGCHRNFLPFFWDVMPCILEESAARLHDISLLKTISQVGHFYWQKKSTG